MKTYQLTYLISPNISKEEIQNLVAKIQSLVQEQEGILIETKQEQKINLGYKIQKNKTAYLNILKIQLPNNNAEIFQKELKKFPQILRFMLQTHSPAKKPGRIPRKTIQKITKEKKVELEEIEEKLEEILGK